MSQDLISKAELSRRAMVTAGAITRACGTILNGAVQGKRIDANHPDVVKYIDEHVHGTTCVPDTGIDELYEAAVAYCRSNQRYTVSNISRGLKIGQARAKKIFAMMEFAGTTTPAPAPPVATTTTTTKPVVKGYNKVNHTKKSAALANKTAELESGTVIHEIPDDINKFADMTLRELIQRFGTDIAFLDWLKATKSIEDINEKRLKNAQTRKELVNIKLVKTGVIEHFEIVFNKLLTDGAKTIARRITSMHSAGRPVEDCEAFVADQVSSFIKPAKAKIARALRNA